MRKKSVFASILNQTVRGLLCACAGLVVAVSEGQGAVTVSISSTVTNPTQAQTDFVAFTTTYFFATSKPGLFPGDIKISLGLPKAVPPPIVVSSPIATATAFQECMTYGVGNGMDIERYANIQQIWGIQAQEALGQTCGGVPIGILKSTTSVLNACIQAYNIATSTISERWGNIYDSKGNIVAP